MCKLRIQGLHLYAFACASTSAGPMKKTCKDCGQGSRPAPFPGPRCATHHRERKKAVSDASHARRVKSVYNITGEEYWALYDYQGGCCYICQRNKGKSKRLQVDHDHSCCSGETSCGKCVRGLACGPCNQMLAHARDDRMMFYRAADYLLEPPMMRMRSDGTD